MKTNFYSLVLLCSSLYLSGSNMLRAQSYMDIASAQNLNFTNQTITANGGGVSCVDFNADGLDDISLATGFGDSLVFFRNTGNGFVKIPSLVNHTQEAQQIIWVDYDNDGDKDLYVSANLSVNKLYRNDSSGFTDVSAAAGLSTSITETYGVCWGDINRDGWLDFYEANQTNFGSGQNHLYLSNGAGSFSNIAVAANADDSIRYSFAPAFLDYDKDGWPDIFVANDRSAPTALLRNLGDSTFQDVGASTGARVIADGMSATIGDYDNNGFLDIYVTNTQSGNKLLRNNANNTFTEVADSMGVGFYSETWSAQFFDYDHDGDLDLHVCDVVIGQSTAQTFFENVDTAFIQPNIFPGDTLKNFASALGDFNNDGYEDLVSPNRFPSSLQLWESNGQANKHWIKVELEGRISNRDAIGSWIEVYAGGQKFSRYTHCGEAYLGQNSQSKIIGIGSATSIDSIRVIWPSGHQDVLNQPGIDKKLHIKEGNSLEVQVFNTGNRIFCEQDSLFTQLQASGGFESYLWNNGDTTAMLTVHQPGNYFVVATNEYGLSDTSNIISILVDSIHLSVNSTADTNMNGLGSASVSVTGGFPPFQYNWNDPQQQTSDTATGLTAGLYKVVVTDSLSCTDTAEVTVLNEIKSSLEERTGWKPQLYPNPAGNVIFLKNNSRSYPGFSKCQVSLYDARGQELTKQKWDMAMPIRISLENLSSGVYFIKLQPVGTEPEAVNFSFTKR